MPASLASVSGAKPVQPDMPMATLVSCAAAAAAKARRGGASGRASAWRMTELQKWRETTDVTVAAAPVSMLRASVDRVCARIAASVTTPIVSPSAPTTASASTPAANISGERVAQATRPRRSRAQARATRSRLDAPHGAAMSASRFSARSAADERLDERVGGLREDRLGRVVLHERAVAQDRDAVAHLERLVDVVRDEHDRLLQLVQDVAGTRPAAARA